MLLLVGKTFFSGTSVSYDNNTVEEEAVKNNMRYICFWDRQIGDLIYDEYYGKNPDFLAECESFSRDMSHTHDDIVDTLVHLINSSIAKRQVSILEVL